MLGVSGCDEVSCSRETQAAISTADRGTQSATKKFSSAGCQTEDDFPDSPLDPFEPDGPSGRCRVHLVLQREAGSVVGVNECSCHLQQSANNSHKTETGEQRSRSTTSRSVRKKAGSGPHTCTMCQRVFPQKNGLASHMRMHVAERRFVCEVCGLSFIYERTLLLHEQLHTNGKLFVCSPCRSLFATQGGLSNHERSHNQPASHKVLSESGGHAHVRRETSENPGGKPFVCGSCQRRFTTKACLVIHERLHTEPFTQQVRSNSSDGGRTSQDACRTSSVNMASTCPICKRHFLQYRSLAIHMRRMHAAKPTKTSQAVNKRSSVAAKTYPCAVCNKRFD